MDITNGGSFMLTALDLFAGAGGFSLGMENSGISVIGAIEIDKFAASTYQRNHPATNFFQGDVSHLEDCEIMQKFSGVDVLFGGPPCQGFSVAGPSQYGKSDPRNQLIFEFDRYARILKPKFIIVENVKGIVNGRIGSKRGALFALAESLENLGYKTSATVIRASDYGVPQTRERVFLVAERDHGPMDFGDLLAARRKTQVINSWDAISDLPLLTSAANDADNNSYSCPPQNCFQKWARCNQGSLSNHVAMKHTSRIIERLKVIGPGQSLKDVGGEHGQRKRNSNDVGVTKVYKMNCFRLDPHEPAITLPANFQTIHVHPHANRMLTAREGARLQSFPDHYIFDGPRTLMSKKLLEREGRLDEIGLSQYNQIGNAVAPRVAEAIGAAILEAETSKYKARR
jgi:DNA (cytosine-5)-methyltransferase 1